LDLDGVLVLDSQSSGVLVVEFPRSTEIGSGLEFFMGQSELGSNEMGISPPTADCMVPFGYAETTRPGRLKAVHIANPPAETFEYRVVKRISDLVLVALMAPVLLPILLVLAVLVKLTSPGPAFFSHRRICQNGAFFSMWKFRTMCVNSSEVLEEYLQRHPEARAEWNLTHKLQDDPRVTRLGRVMRRLSLDELPQVWNVITGRMTLVGPRPIVAAEVEKYGDCFHCYTCVKPGVTGLWQVSGRSTLSYDARVSLDCEYVKHWSLARDLKILAATMRSVVNQEGAY
jgi:lipopolysaccharide/colanic/teichoic acid biosynthesis glycosyltransferase